MTLTKEFNSGTDVDSGERFSARQGYHEELLRSATARAALQSPETVTMLDVIYGGKTRDEWFGRSAMPGQEEVDVS